MKYIFFMRDICVDFSIKFIDVFIKVHFIALIFISCILLFLQPRKDYGITDNNSERGAHVWSDYRLSDLFDALFR